MLFYLSVMSAVVAIGRRLAGSCAGMGTTTGATLSFLQHQGEVSLVQSGAAMQQVSLREAA